MFFGGARGGRGGNTRKQTAKVKPTKKALDITLEDSYNGKVVKV